MEKEKDIKKTLNHYLDGIKKLKNIIHRKDPELSQFKKHISVEVSASTLDLEAEEEMDTHTQDGHESEDM